MRAPLRVIALVFSFGVMTNLTWAQTTVHGQSYRSCAEHDTACLTKWWQEYREGLIDEFIRWRKFEKEFGNNQINLKAAQMIGSAAADQDKYYRHELWLYPQVTKIDGISNSDFDAIWGRCRVAIIEMKFVVVGLAEPNSVFGYRSASSLLSDIRDYSEDARLCEKQFHIPFDRE